MNIQEGMLLQLLKAHILQEAEIELETENVPEEVWRSLGELAALHQVLPIIYETLREQQLIRLVPEALVLPWKRETQGIVLLQIRKTGTFLKIYQKLTEQACISLVMKGLICRELYPKPDYRVSADEDILIRKEDFAACDRILQEEGMVRKEIELSDLPAEVGYYHPDGTYIELHMKLFPEEEKAYGHWNREFKHIFEDYKAVRIQGTGVYTFSDTAHMLYLLFHSFKHFFHGGVGIRQLCDIILYAQHYGQEIDWEYIQGVLESWSMDYLWLNILDIGERYLGFSMEKAGIPVAFREKERDCEALLEDILDGGVYGRSSMARRHSAHITLSAVKNEKGRHVFHGLRSALFPERVYLEETYLYLKKRKYLIWAAWLHRIFSYIRRSLREQKNRTGERDSLEMGKRRVELLKKYKVIK